MIRNLKMIVAYDGTRYAGWQVQPYRETIQGVLEDRLSRMLKERVRIAGAGRTDAGVHARGQVANFTTATSIPAEGLRRGLNDRLPQDIRVLAAAEADPSFHAREQARGKEYRYRMVLGEVLSPFDARFGVHLRGSIDVDAMREAVGAFIGRHDFTSFCASGCRVKTRERNVFLSELVKTDCGLEYRVGADGFLQHMVRNIVGTLLDVGRGLRKASDIEALLVARDRRAAGPCAPPQGLVLERVHYEEAG